MESIPIEFPNDWINYQLLDSGEGEKLESFSSYVVIRPDPRAIWPKRLPIKEWQKANALFNRNSKTGGWIYKTAPPKDWVINYQNFQFKLAPTDFRHVGIFPEQASNWKWLKKQINGKPLKILNLFAYTGGATLASVLAGGKPTHVDSSKSAITWANENMKLSKISENSVRWIFEDAYKFVEKEIRRGSHYDGIILDPPRFGHGTKGEVWKLENDLSELMVSCRKLLSKDSKFLLLNVYTSDLSPIAVNQLVVEILKDLGGETSTLELALKEKDSERLLPSGITSRWRRDY